MGSRRPTSLCLRREPLPIELELPLSAFALLPCAYHSRIFVDHLEHAALELIEHGGFLECLYRSKESNVLAIQLAACDGSQRATFTDNVPARWMLVGN